MDFWVYRKKRASQTNVKNYFLAEVSLTWWAIGASLMASNISAEQFIGMSGSDFKMELAIASYEWMFALTLIVAAVFFIPVYLKSKIYTMPRFLAKRYNNTVAMIMVVFWLCITGNIGNVHFRIFLKKHNIIGYNVCDIGGFIFFCNVKGIF